MIFFFYLDEKLLSLACENITAPLGKCTVRNILVTGEQRLLLTNNQTTQHKNVFTIHLPDSSGDISHVPTF